MTFEDNAITAAEFSALTDSVGWGRFPAEQVRAALDNSLYTVVAREDGRAIGMGRVCGDGALTFYIKDVVVLPARQNAGIGREIMKHLLRFVQDSLQPGWPACVELMAAKQAEGFYSSLGFISRPTPDRGPGMSLWIKR